MGIGATPGDVETFALSLVCVLFACLNLLLLVGRGPSSERRFWRNVGIGRLRRRLTGFRGAPPRHRDADTLSFARTNILWHAGLSLLAGAMMFHPSVQTWALRPARYVLVFGVVMYFVGSLVQRQKILIVRAQRRRRPAERAA